MASSSTSCSVWLISYGQSSESHQALFIELAKEGNGSKGTLLHVQGPEDAPRQRRVSMWFDPREDYAAFATPSYRNMGSKQLVGLVEKGNVSIIRSICQRVKPPSVPQNHHPKKPNCRSWIKNVLYQCSEENVITFERTFDIPKNEEKLQI